MRTAAWRIASRSWCSVIGVLLMVMLMSSACSNAAGEGTTDDITIFAAASLRDVLPELETAWQAGRPGVSLTVAHDGSNILAAQIAEGAPADVFLSADLSRPQRLVSQSQAAGPVVPFARTSVSLVVPVDSDVITSPADLARPGVRIVAAGPSVPITDYAEEALDQLAATMADPTAFRDAIAGNIVTREDNVRAALAKVALGEGDAALVYGTDVASSDRVREVQLPTSIEVSADYGAVQVSDDAIAAAFMTWLMGEEARAVLLSAGFELPA